MASAPGDDLKALTAALDHARAMANFAAEIRTRNFNFFVVVSAALITGFAKLAQEWTIIFEVVGVLTSFMFFGLDIRGHGLHKRSVDQMVVLEPLVWKRAGIHGWVPIPRHGGMRFFSHRWIYRSFFVVVGVGWILASVFDPTRK